MPATRRAPDPAKVAAIPCAVERAALISRHARKESTLLPDLAAMRIAAVHEAHANGCSIETLARACERTKPRIVQLLALARAGMAAVESEATS